MLSVLHSQYHACWCSGDFRSQGISRNGIDPQNLNVMSPALEELIHFEAFVHCVPNKNLKIAAGLRLIFWKIEKNTKVFCEFHYSLKNRTTSWKITLLHNMPTGFMVPFLNTLRARQNGRHFAEDLEFWIKFDWNMFFMVLSIWQHWFR